jgi:hypothetical protein
MPSCGPGCMTPERGGLHYCDVVAVARSAGRAAEQEQREDRILPGAPHGRGGQVRKGRPAGGGVVQSVKVVE